MTRIGGNLDDRKSVSRFCFRLADDNPVISCLQKSGDLIITHLKNIQSNGLVECCMQSVKSDIRKATLCSRDRYGTAVPSDD